jgi:alpha-amylase
MTPSSKLLYCLLLFLLIACSKEKTTEENSAATSFERDPQLSFVDNAVSNDVFFQSFWWDVIFDSKVNPDFYTYLQNEIAGLAAAHFDLIWLPPPSDGEGMGYHPRKLFDFNSNYGTASSLEQLLNSIKQNQLHAMADLVLNHRVGTANWTDFTAPAWSCESICSDDESVTDPSAFGTTPCGALDEGEAWHGARDLNHKSEEVQNGIIEYLERLQQLGFDSWRYDFVKGYPAKYVATYNEALPYYYSVGEYWDGDGSKIKAWMEATKTTVHGANVPASGAFDFELKYRLKEALVNFQYALLDTQVQRVGVNGYENYGSLAVTFLDNHDSGCINRSDCDNLFSKNTAAIRKGYAYLLTHPGIPMVWAYHYFFQDASGELQEEIKNLIYIRKKYGITAQSSVAVIAAISGFSGHYVASIDNKVLIKIGKKDYTPDPIWEPLYSTSDYSLWVLK